MRMYDQYRHVIADALHLFSSVIGRDYTAPAGEPVCVDITEPVALYHEQNERQIHVRDDIPCALSPFDVAFYESLAPARVAHKGELVEASRINPYLRRLGWTVVTTAIDERLRSEMPAFNPVAAALARAAGAEIDAPRCSLDGLTPAFVQVTTAFAAMRKGSHEECNMLLTVVDYLDADGRVIGGARVTLSSDEQLGGECATPLFFSLAFLHCKNTALVDEPIPERLKRARASKGCEPGTVFKVLRIDPMRDAIRREAGDSTGVRRALHICRGHFARYTPERPLFGRITGTFWVPAHVRGSRDVGEVRKSYQIGAPQRAER